MDELYLNRVLIFLQQELPEYKHDLALSNGVLIFAVPAGQGFQAYYEALLPLVSICIARIRNLEHDLDFSVRSAYQERDFRLYKNVKI